MIATATGPHIYWIVSRAAGIAALMLSSASVGLGVTMAGRFVRRPVRDLRIAHEALALATIAALAVHGLSLVGDGFIGMSLTDVSVPFASSYKTLWTTMGIVGAWLLVLLGLAYYARTRIGPARFKVLHRFTLLGWVLGVAHSLGEGTDAGVSWFLVSVGAVGIPAIALVLVRAARARRALSATSQAPLAGA
jgi:sulfoxide reductase heme-binding subunit YedZ